MNDIDTQEFFKLLDMISEQCGKPKKSLETKTFMLEVLGKYGFKNIKGAIFAHLQDPAIGMFDVTIAHIQAQITKAIEKDGRPAADEAWTIALALDDESATVVTNDEISQAWAVAREAMPDKTAARMAFRAVYERLCSEARKQHKKPSWFPSLGTDEIKRSIALEQAERRGILQLGQASVLCTGIKRETSDFLALQQSGDGVDNLVIASKCSEKGREAIQAMKQMLQQFKDNAKKMATSSDE